MTRTLSSFRKRIRQGVQAIAARRGTHRLPNCYHHQLPEAIVARWQTLSSYDQRHLLDVAEDLHESGYDRHTVLAGLLHDIGKPARTPALSRATRVLLRQLKPGMRESISRRLQSLPVLWHVHGLHHHAGAGADFLEEHGIAPEVVWLVRHHEESLPHGQLAALQDADERH